MIGYEVTIVSFIELGDDPGLAKEKCSDINKAIKRHDERAIAKIMQGAEITVRLKTKRNPPPKPSNKPARIINADVQK